MKHALVVMSELDSAVCVTAGHCSGDPLRSGGGRMSGALLRSSPGRQARLLLPGRHGPREHEGLWYG